MWYTRKAIVNRTRCRSQQYVRRSELRRNVYTSRTIERRKVNSHFYTQSNQKRPEFNVEHNMLMEQWSWNSHSVGYRSVQQIVVFTIEYARLWTNNNNKKRFTLRLIVFESLFAQKVSWITFFFYIFKYFDKLRYTYACLTYREIPKDYRHLLEKFDPIYTYTQPRI